MPTKRILVLRSGANESYDQIRILRPLNWPGVRAALWSEGVHVETAVCEDISPQTVQGVDHLVVHGVGSPNLMNIVRKLPCPFSIFQDDIMRTEHMPPWNPVKITTVHDRTLDYCLEHAATIVCTTAEIARFIDRPEKTLVQGNLEDFDKPPEGEPDRLSRAIFVGGSSHAGDLELLNGLDWPGQTVIWSSCLPSSKIAMHRNVMGHLEMRPNDPRWAWIPIEGNYERYQVCLKNLAPRFGIGLAPLVDCQFNRAKSILRFLEATKCGWVTVASDVGPYAEIPDECCVKVGPHDNLRPAPRPIADWNGAILFGAACPQIAARAWHYCRANHSYQEHWRSWVETYRRIAAA